MRIRKKKVSFDIDVDELELINNYCEINNYRKSDFFREAAIKYLKEKSTLKELYYFDNVNNKFVSLLIDVNFFNVQRFNADDLTKKSFKIKNIVLIKLKNENLIDEVKDENLKKYLKLNNFELKCFEK